MKQRILALALLVPLVLLEGCATSRSEVRLASPPPAAARAPDANAPAVLIRSVKDERVFEQAPDEPSTPSLGFEGAAQATADIKARAIGRKRNSFGKALGDVLLQEGQTVAGVVRENLAAALTAAGYRVADEKTADPNALVVDVRIRKFWSWIQPGFWAITVAADIATDVDVTGASGPTTISAHVEDGRQIVTEGAWLETLGKALQAWRQDAEKKLPAPPH